MKDKIMAEKIANRVNQFGGKTYYVGGYVRDKVLGIDNKDIDIEVHNITPDTLKNIISEFGEIKVQGASFGVYNIKGYDIDIAQPRMEQAIGRGHKDFEVTVDPFIGTEKAAVRRDFTINALMEDVITGEIVDHFNGLNDIKHGIIRHIDDITFSEDPLRVLRAAQFAARFNFSIAPETIDIMSKMNLNELSKERIYEEMKKAMLKSNKPSIFFNILNTVNQLDYWFPEIKALINCPQNSMYHPEGDVWVHTMNTIDFAATIKNKTTNPEFFMIAALCHDFGKPSSTTIDSNGIAHNINHEKLGIDVAKSFMDRLNPNVAMCKYVLNMVENHMKLHSAFNNKSKIKSTNAKFDVSICPNDLVNLTIADSASKGTIYTEEMNWITDRLSIYEARMKEPEVTGKDLIELGIKPGPQFTEILKMTHKQHLSGVAKENVIKGVKTMFLK